MIPFVDTWCVTCRTWHSSTWVHLGNRMVKVDDVTAPLLEQRVIHESTTSVIAPGLSMEVLP